MGAAECIAGSTARNSHEREDVVLARNQAGGDRPHVISSEGAYSNERFSCFFVQNNLAKEVSLGRVFGPTSVPALENVQLSRFGVIPKKDGGWRLILDLSFPCGHSVNDGINKEEFTLTYSKVSDAISLIVKTGRGALMGKVDTKSAYRIIPIHPSNHHLLGMFWQGAYYIAPSIAVWLAFSTGYI